MCGVQHKPRGNWRIGEIERYSKRLEHDTRRLPVVRHALINGVRQQATPAEIGGKLFQALADRLGIARSEAHRRIEEAHDLGERQALTGEPVPARLAATAAAERAGLVGNGSNPSRSGVVNASNDKSAKPETASRNASNAATISSRLLIAIP